MWAFDSFPAKMEYEPEGNDRPVYQVEVLGYLRMEGGVDLVVHRMNSYWVAPEIGEVCLLPTVEFEEKFKKYTLINEGS